MDLGSAVGSIILNYEGKGAVSQAKSDLASLESAGSNIAKGMDVVGKTMLGIGAAAAVPIGLAAKAGIDFGREMANVNSILQLSDEEIAALGDSVQGLSATTAKAPAELAAGLYDIASSGFTGADGLLVLEAAANAANAGLTTTATSARGISSVLNAYNMDASEAQRVSDVMFQTVQDGVLTFEGLTNNMGNTLPLASALGISFEELGAGYAQLTLQGQNASAAETNLASLMRASLNPTEALTEAVEAYGFESAESLIAAEGLPGLLKAIDQGAGGSKEALFDMLGSQEAMNAALVLAEDDAAGYIDELGNMEGASEGAGATQEALAKQAQSAGYQLDRLGAAIAAFQTSVGEQLEPIIAGVAAALGDFAFMLADMPAGIQQFIGLFGGITAGLGLIGGGALIATAKFLELQKSLNAAGISLKKFGLGLGLAGLAIGAGILAYQNNIGGFADFVDEKLARAQEAAKAFGESFKKGFSGRQAAGFNKVASGIGAFGEALDEALGTGTAVQEKTDELGRAIQALDVGFQNGIANGLNPFSAALLGVQNAVAELGFRDLALRIADAKVAAQTFGDTFAEAGQKARDAGFDETQGTVVALGEAIDAAFGTDVSDQFLRAAEAMQAFAEGAQEARDAGLSEIEANLIGIRDAMSELTGLDLGTFFDNLGSNFGGLADGVREVAGAILDGDWERAGDVLTAGLQDLSTWAQEGLQSLSDNLMATLGSIDLEEVRVNIGNWAADRVADFSAFIKEHTGVDLGESLDLGDVTVVWNWAMGEMDSFETWLSNALQVGPGGVAKGQELGEGLADLLQSGLQFAFDSLTGEAPAGGDEDVWGFADYVEGQGTDFSLGNAFQALDKAFTESMIEFFEGLEIPTPTADWITGPLQEMVDAASAQVEAIFAPLADTIERAGLQVLKALEVLPGDQGLGGIISEIEENLFGMSEAQAELMSEVVTGAGLGGEETGEPLPPGTLPGTATEEQITDAYDEAETTLIEGARQGQADMDRILQAEQEEARQALEDGAADPPIWEGVGEEIGKGWGGLWDGFREFAAAGVQGADAAEATDDVKEMISDEVSAVGEGPELAEAGTQAGENAGATVADPMMTSLAQSMTQAVSSADAATFQQVGAALMTKVGDSLNLAMNAAGTKGAQLAGSGDIAASGGGIGQSLLTSLASALSTAITSAAPETFSGVGTALMTKLSEGMSAAMAAGAPIGDQAVSEAGTGAVGTSMAQQVVTSLASSLTAAIAAVDPAIFAPAGQALMTKLGASMGQAMNAAGTSGAQLAGSGDIATAGGGIGASIVTSLASSLSTAIAAVGPEAFASAGSALMGKLSEAMSAAMAGTGPAMEGGRVGAAAAGGLGASMVTSIATSLAASITAAPPEAFLAVGTALQAKISEVLATAFTGGTETGQGGPGGSGGAAPTGIGASIATMLATAVEGADFTSFQNALITKVGEALSEFGAYLEEIFVAVGEAFSMAGEGWGTALAGSVATAIAAGTSAATAATTIGQTLISSVIAGLGGAGGTSMQGAQLSGSGDIAPSGGTGGLSGAVTGMVTSAISAGTSAASGATAIGSALVAAATAGIGGGGAPSAPGGNFGAGGMTGTGTAEGGGGTFSGAVTTMVTTGIAAGEGAASGATSIGAAFSAGAAAGIDISAMVQPAIDMVNAAIAAAEGAAGIASPSTVARDRIGQPIAEGAAVGVDEGAASFIDSIRQMVDEALTRIFEAVGLARDAGSQLGAAVGEGAEAGAETATGEAVAAGEAVGTETGTATGTAANEALGSSMDACAPMVGAVEEAAGCATDAIGSTMAPAVSDAAGTAMEDAGSTMTDAAGTAGTEAGTAMAEGAETAVADGGTDVADAAGSAGEAAGSSFGSEMASAMLGQMELGGDGIGGQAIQSILSQLGTQTESVAEAGTQLGTTLGESVTSGAETAMAESGTQVGTALGESVGQGATDALAGLDLKAMGVPEQGIAMAESIMAGVSQRLAAMGIEWQAVGMDVAAKASERGRGMRGAQQPITINLKSELDGEVLDERIVEVTAGGLQEAFGRNPLTRRRRV